MNIASVIIIVEIIIAGGVYFLCFQGRDHIYLYKVAFWKV